MGLEDIQVRILKPRAASPRFLRCGAFSLVIGAQAHADFNIYGTIPRACGWGEAHQAPQRRMHVEMYAVRRRHFVGGRIVSVGRSGRCSGFEPGTA